MVYARKLSFISFISGTVDEFDSAAFKTGLVATLRGTGVTTDDIELVVASGSVKVDALITTTTDLQANGVTNILSGHAGKSVPEQLMELGEVLGVSFERTGALEDAIVAIAIAPPPPSSPPPPSPVLSPRESEASLSAGNDLEGGAIAGIIVGVLVAVGLLVFLWFCVRRAYGNGKKDEYSDIRSEPGRKKVPS